MNSILTTLLIATQINVAEAKRPHQHAHHAHRDGHVHVTHRHHHYRVERPLPPRRAAPNRSVYFYRGHWVVDHKRPGLVWKWNNHTGRWVIVFRF